MRPGCDVIIPVYNAYEDLRRCVASVYRSTSEPYRLILIDDCSTDPRIREYLAGLTGTERRPAPVILRNRRNLGFVHTANVGLSLSANDAVLLNSDTIVTAGWLDKLAECAVSRPDAATVTPLTNNGSICSAPDFCRPGPLPPGHTVDSFAALVERVSGHFYPELPTAVGFCMYIRRQALKRVGLFDAELFGRGYGEENDFSCRAAALGYCNLLDDATFVYHRGTASFGEERQLLSQQNTRRLAERRPDFFWRVEKFIAANPLQEILKRLEDSL